MRTPMHSRMFFDQTRPIMKSRNTSPLVSIVLCTYNRRNLLPRALHSVREQTYRNWELIVIDDGSTDDSESLLRTFARSERRMKYRRHANKGLASSRNAGLKLARGTYVTFLDSDDEYTPGHLAKRVAYLQSHRNLDGIYGGMKIIGPRHRHYVPDVDRPGKKIHASRCHAAGTLLATRVSLAGVGGFRRVPFSEDYDLIDRLRQRCVLGRVGFRTYLYHVDSDNRLCDLFERGGAGAILHYRRGAMNA